MLRWIVLACVLLLSACSAHRFGCYCPETTLLTIQMVEKRWGTPNEVISKHPYTWYGYVTKLQNGYPVKQNFSKLSLPGAIAKPVPVAHTNPKNSSAKYGCSVWYKADSQGVIVSIRHEGAYCRPEDWRVPVGT